MLDTVSVLGDRLLGLLVPRVTAAADHCWSEYYCTNNYCEELTLNRWRERYYCCDGFCTRVALTCAC